MDCLVTGGAGFIGSPNIVDGLLARGDRVTVIDDLLTGKRDNLGGAHRRRGRAPRSPTSGTAPTGSPRSSPPSAPRSSSTWRLRSTSATRSLIRPELDAITNVLGTIHVLDASLRASGARRGRQQLQLHWRRPLRRRPAVLPTLRGPSDPPGQAPYGQAKFAAEGYSRPVSAAARALDGLAPALRQRLRPPPGRPR